MKTKQKNKKSESLQRWKPIFGNVTNETTVQVNHNSMSGDVSIYIKSPKGSAVVAYLSSEDVEDLLSALVSSNSKMNF